MGLCCDRAATVLLRSVDGSSSPSQQVGRRGPWGSGRTGWTLVGALSVWGDGNSLEVDGGNGCTPSCTGRVPQGQTLRRGLNGRNFLCVYVYHNKGKN